jgi:hypothetical protein
LFEYWRRLTVRLGFGLVSLLLAWPPSVFSASGDAGASLPEFSFCDWLPWLLLRFLLRRLLRE